MHSSFPALLIALRPLLFLALCLLPPEVAHVLVSLSVLSHRNLPFCSGRARYADSVLAPEESEPEQFALTIYSYDSSVYHLLERFDHHLCSEYDAT